MKSIFDFIKTTITGGVLFLLPVVLLIIILSKAYIILHKISAPISKKMPELIFGLDGSSIVVILLLILICFVSGLLFRSIYLKKWIDKIENNVLVNLPGYALIKTITAGAMGKGTESDMTPILIHEDDSWGLAFLIEKGEKLSTVFIPDAPRHDAGEIKIIPTSRIKKLDISTSKFILSIKSFGKGAIHWTE